MTWQDWADREPYVRCGGRRLVDPEPESTMHGIDEFRAGQLLVTRCQGCDCLEIFRVRDAEPWEAGISSAWCQPRGVCSG